MCESPNGNWRRCSWRPALCSSVGQPLTASCPTSWLTHEVRSLGGVVLGTPLHTGALHKDVRALLERQRAALEQTPVALFALGPVKDENGVEGSCKQLDAALAKLPWLYPVATEVFVGAYDPATVGFKDKMIAALSASPLHGELARDERDWEAIRGWARRLCGESDKDIISLEQWACAGIRRHVVVDSR